MKELINRLKNQSFIITDEVSQRNNLTFITISKEQAILLITHLRDFEKYTHLSFLTAVDYIEQEQFQLVYMLHNYERKHSLGIRVRISRENAQMISIHHLWQQAKTYQQELKEMFGIDFPGSPGIDEPFALEGWDNMPPLRRDFDTKKYSEETYGTRPGRKHYDPQEYMKEKLYPEKEAEVKK